MEKITIHRALAELKLIGARIDKAIDELVPAGIYQEGRTVGNSNYAKDDFEKLVKEKYQSVTDLIQRRNTIKTKIVQANAVTVVKIGQAEMTIADAINLRAIIELKKKLAASMKQKLRGALTQAEKHNSMVDANALKLAESALQKTNIKISDSDVQGVIEPYLKVNRALITDPLGVEKEVEKIEKEVSEFETEVDAALSEINATTFIEI